MLLLCSNIVVRSWIVRKLDCSRSHIPADKAEKGATDVLMTQIYSQALIAIVLLLPGAIAGSAFQRCAPRYNDRFRDWLLRILGISALFLVLGSWPLYWMYSNYWDALVAGEPLPKLLFLAPIVYLILPMLLGWRLGVAVAENKPWAVRLAGENRAPLAWDHLFGTSAEGFIRCRLHSGRWVGGYYGGESPDKPKSYASVDPNNLDIYIGCAFEFEQKSGTPILKDDEYVLIGGGILIKWADIETLEFQQINNDKTTPQNFERKS